MTAPDPARFQPVRLEHRDELTRFLASHDVVFCEYNFATLFMWGEQYRIAWLIHENRLWIRSLRDNVTLMPVGEPVPAAELHGLCRQWRQAGGCSTIALADDEYLADNPGIESLFRVEPDPANCDYVYLTQKLAELRGNKLSRKRNLVSQFRAAFPDAEITPLTPDDSARCLELAEKWCIMRDCIQLGFDPEESALKRGLQHFAAIGLAGLKLMVGQRLLAFSIWSQLNGDTADIHFEKFDPEVKGAAQAINQEVARHLSASCTHLNREQDLGLEGLRRAKLSYYPEYIVRAYTLTPLP